MFLFAVFILPTETKIDYFSIIVSHYKAYIKSSIPEEKELR